MAKYTAIVVDDEPAARKLLESFIAESVDFTVVGSASSGAEALSLIANQPPDLLLLDIQMPEMDGFALLKRLEPPLPIVVFVTAFDEYAIQAFEVNALDYLLKPVAKRRFVESMIRAKTQLQSGSDNSAVIMELLQNYNIARQGSYKTNLISKEKGKSHLVPVEEIIFIEALDNYVKIHLEKQFKVGNYRLGDVEQSLDPDVFTRVHRSFIVNRKKIKAVEPYFHGEYHLFFDNGLKVKLSRSYRHKLDLILNG